MDEAAEAQQRAFEDAIREAQPAQFPDFTVINEGLQAKARGNVHHVWRQQGPYLVCFSCSHQHSQWIGPLKKLVGFDNGRPKIEDVKL